MHRSWGGIRHSEAVRAKGRREAEGKTIKSEITLSDICGSL